jgi:hypothetical protein
MSLLNRRETLAFHYLTGELGVQGAVQIQYVAELERLCILNFYC